LRLIRSLLLVTSSLWLLACPFGSGPQSFHFTHPAENQLSLAGDVAVRLKVPAPLKKKGAVLTAVTLDGDDITGLFVKDQATVPTPAGHHQLAATLRIDGVELHTTRSFEAILVTEAGACDSLSQADCFALNAQVASECEIFNSVECLLPYPSSQLLQPAATPTGVRPNIPQIGCPG